MSHPSDISGGLLIGVFAKTVGGSALSADQIYKDLTRGMSNGCWEEEEEVAESNLVS